MDPKSRLVERISRNGDPHDEATPAPLVTLEEFFEGNDDGGSWSATRRLRLSRMSSVRSSSASFPGPVCRACK